MDIAHRPWRPKNLAWSVAFLAGLWVVPFFAGSTLWGDRFSRGNGEWRASRPLWRQRRDVGCPKQCTRIHPRDPSLEIYTESKSPRREPSRSGHCKEAPHHHSKGERFLLGDWSWSNVTAYIDYEIIEHRNIEIQEEERGLGGDEGIVLKTGPDWSVRPVQ